MTFRSSIYLALFSLIAFSGCSTDTWNVPGWSNPFSGFNSTATKPTTQDLLKADDRENRLSALDWFRRGGSKATAVPPAAPSGYRMLDPRSAMTSQTAAAAFSQPSTTMGSASYPMAVQPTATPNPYGSPANMTASQYGTSANGPYGAHAQYPAPMPYNPGATNPAMPPTAYPQTASYGAAYGAAPQPAQPYAQYPATSSPGMPATPVPYSSARHNTPQYSQQGSVSGSILR